MIRHIVHASAFALIAAIASAPALASDCPADKVGTDVTKPGPEHGGVLCCR